MFKSDLMSAFQTIVVKTFLNVIYDKQIRANLNPRLQTGHNWPSPGQTLGVL